MSSNLQLASPLPPAVLQRKAVIYVRHSTKSQVLTNLESQRRQYDLVETARSYGFNAVEVIDDDLGKSASGSVARPGFERLVAGLCRGTIGAVFCLEASRLARNGHDWHHVLELCGLVEARIIDHEGVYDPCRPNGRLLLGMKGSISEFELGLMQSRMLEAARSKARRGELRYTPPIGYIWDRDIGLGFDPDIRIQEVIRLIFAKFRELGSARQVLLWMSREQISFPRPSDGIRLVSFEWRPVRYRNVIGVLKNTFYAGVYAYGKTGKSTQIKNGRAYVTYKNKKPLEEWDVFLKDHHEGYIDWAQYERNQAQLGHNAYGKSGGAKSARGGGALLAGLLSCAGCGRRLHVVYTGRKPRPVYRCDRPNLMLGAARCIRFGGARADKAVTEAILQAVAPIAITAAQEAEQRMKDEQQARLDIIDLELQQARYEASLAERRYAACDPQNRLIAAQLEQNWEAALRRVEILESRLGEQEVERAAIQMPDMVGLAEDLEAAWCSPTTTMRQRQHLLRTLVEDIIADIDEAVGDIVLTIHWKGGQHTILRTKKPRPGEHGCRTPADALAVIKEMAGRWSDDHIAASLNRMGMRTGQNKTWNAKRVSSIRRVNGINGYLSADKAGQWCTMTQAAQRLGVTNHVVRRLINDKVLPARQVVPGAPYQIKRSDLKSEQTKAALGRKRSPCRTSDQNQLQMFSNT